MVVWFAAVTVAAIRRDQDEDETGNAQAPREHGHDQHEDEADSGPDAVEQTQQVVTDRTELLEVIRNPDRRGLLDLHERHHSPRAVY